MAFLDDELAAEERRELELHLLDCPTCRTHVDAERSEIRQLRTRLAPPPAPDLLKARLAVMLDGEDLVAAKAQRRWWSQVVLPAGAVLAAAAALLVFIGVKPSANEVGSVAQEVTRQSRRPMPLEVEGPSTGPWLRAHFPSQAAPPRFERQGIRLVGARLTAVNGHDAAMLQYQIRLGDYQSTVMAVMIADLQKDELGAGAEWVVGQRTLHVIDADGIPGVTFVSPSHVGYAFFSPEMSQQQLLELVVTSDLIERTQAGQ